MKKQFELFGMLLLGLGVLSSCSAPEPDSPIPADETYLLSTNQDDRYISNYDIGEQDSEDFANPADFLVNSWGENYNGGYSFTYDFSNRVSSISRQSNNYDNQEINYSIDYAAAADQTPSEISIKRYVRDMADISISGRLHDIQWDGNLMTAATYDETLVIDRNEYDDYGNRITETKEATRLVTFSYDRNQQLTMLTVNGVEYPFVWDANGDLKSFESPEYGNVEIVYYGVKNIKRQWDPSLPIMGPMQLFGWFGKAPAHYVEITEQKKPADEYYNLSEVNKSIKRDYLLHGKYNNPDLNGLIYKFRIYYSNVVNDYTEYEVNYQPKQNK